LVTRWFSLTKQSREHSAPDSPCRDSASHHPYVQQGACANGEAPACPADSNRGGSAGAAAERVVATSPGLLVVRPTRDLPRIAQARDGGNGPVPGGTPAVAGFGTDRGRKRCRYDPVGLCNGSRLCRPPNALPT